MTVGDVNAVAWIIGSTGVTLWTSIVGTSVLFRERAKRAALAAEQDTPKTLGLGAGIMLGAGLLTVILINQPNGLFKLIGWVLLACLILLAILGSAGLSTVAAERIGHLNRRLSPLACIGRGAGLLVVAGFLPFVGWALLFPAMLMLSLGAGWRGLRMKVIPEASTVATQTSASV